MALVRKFYLLDGTGKPFELSNLKEDEIVVLTEPSGLGTSFTIESIDLTTHSVITNASFTFQTISATINFVNKPYDKYLEFVNYLEDAVIKNNPTRQLTLAYEIPLENGIETFYKNVLPISFSKGELDISGILICDIELKSLSSWSDKKLNEFENLVIDSETSGVVNSKIFDYPLPHKYSFEIPGEPSFLEILGTLTTPLKIEILAKENGFSNPELFIQNLNGEIVATLKLNISINAGEEIIVNAIPNQLGIAKIDINGITGNVSDSRDMMTNTYINLPKGKFQVGVQVETGEAFFTVNWKNYWISR